jgi:hypothetical protein
MTSPDPNGQAGAALPASAFTATDASTRRVRLIKTHIHAGLPHKVGDEIDLWHDLANWLIAEGAAQPVEAAIESLATKQATPFINPRKDKST